MNDMIAVQSISTVLAYHSYKIGGVLCKEYARGNETEGFFLNAKEIPHPERFPSISCALYDERGALVLAMRKNAVIELGDGYCEKLHDGGVEIVDEQGKTLFGYRVRRYQNVAVTEIFGEWYDQSGEKISL